MQRLLALVPSQRNLLQNHNVSDGHGFSDPRYRETRNLPNYPRNT